MAITAKESGTKRTYINAPADTYQGVCVDVVDLGIVTPKNPEYKPAHKIRVVFQLDEPITEKIIKNAKKANGDTGKLTEFETELVGQRFTISQMFTLSLHERAQLRKTLEAWRGTPCTAEELNEGFDVEELIGTNANVNVVHNVFEGKTYANIASLSPWKKKLGAEIEPENYVRAVDRPAKGDQMSKSNDDDEDDEDEPIPFKKGKKK